MDQWNYMEKVFGGTEYNNLAPGHRFNACFGPIYIIKNSLAKKFYDSGVLANMQSTCKLHDEVGERIFGILARMFEILAKQSHWEMKPVNRLTNFQEP